jgi:hypothetical protein
VDLIGKSKTVERGKGKKKNLRRENEEREMWE